MISLESLLEPGESLAGLEDSSLGCDVYMVTKPGRGEHDRVFLDIRSRADACVLIGGNSFKIETLVGFGRLSLLDLATGTQRNIFLEPGVEEEVPVGVVYAYENCGEEGSQFILRDTAKNFKLADEVTAKSMAAVVSGIFLLSSK